MGFKILRFLLIVLKKSFYISFVVFHVSSFYVSFVDTKLVKVAGFKLPEVFIMFYLIFLTLLLSIIISIITY